MRVKGTRVRGVELGKLYEQPFTDYYPPCVEGLFPDTAADEIIRIVAAINRNAGWSVSGSGQPATT